MPQHVISISVDDFVNIESIRALFPQLQTPNYDRLRDMGVSLDNTFATTALCTPSRTAILTGQSPFTTGVHSNQDEWESRVNINNTWPAIMRAAGYDVYGYGKIFPGLQADQAAQVFDVFRDNIGNPLVETGTSDYLNVQDAIQTLNNHDLSNPLLLMLGLHDPHGPQVSPPEYTDMYPASEIVIPDWEHETDMPAFIVDFLNTIADKTPDEARADIAAYLANITEMDSRLGEFLDAVEAKPDFDPVIAIWADHGFHLGDHTVHTGKFTLWDQADRMPFVIIDPSAPAGTSGQSYQGVVSGLDVGPTILGLAGLPIPAHMEGRSVANFIDDPSTTHDGVAITNMFGSVSIRTNGWRYTRYEDGSVELFKIGSNDPFNLTNLASDPAFDAAEHQMRNLLEFELLKYNTVIDEAKDVVKANPGGGDSTYFIYDTTDLRVLRNLDSGGYDMLYTTIDITAPNWAETVSISDVTVRAEAGLKITGNALNNMLVGGNGKDTLSGLNGSDKIDGGRGNDTISGGNGNDGIIGDNGKDRLNGDKGNDTLIGGGDNDLMVGGGDYDTFVFIHSGPVATSDRVLDYVKGVDVLRLEGSAWNSVSVTANGVDTIVQAGAHTVILDNTAHMNLSKADFIIIS